MVSNTFLETASLSGDHGLRQRFMNALCTCFGSGCSAGHLAEACDRIEIPNAAVLGGNQGLNPRQNCCLGLAMFGAMNIQLEGISSTPEHKIILEAGKGLQGLMKVLDYNFSALRSVTTRYDTYQPGSFILYPTPCLYARANLIQPP